MFLIGNERVAVVTDSICDLPDDRLAKAVVHMIPLRVSCLHGEFRDRTEITADEVRSLLPVEQPQTLRPAPEDITACYRTLIDEGCTQILHFPTAAELSGSFQLAEAVGEAVSGASIHVIDLQSVSGGLGLLVDEAVRCLERGDAPETVPERLTHLRANQLTAFVPRTLRHLRRGGRLDFAAAAAHLLPPAVPVLVLDDAGTLQPLLKGSDFDKAVSAMTDELVSRYSGKPVRLAVMHSGAPEAAESLLAALQEKLQMSSSFLCEISPALTVHVGPGALGVSIQYVV